MKKIALFLAVFCIVACKPQQKGEERDAIKPLADSKANSATRNLYNRLNSLLQRGILLGHQDDLAYGHNWYDEEGRSDVHDVTAKYPAVMGWEIGHIEQDALYNLDSVYFDRMKRYIREANQLGAINTISWHADNIATGGSAWDCAQDNVVKSVLPDSENHVKFLSWLDRLADFFLDLKDDKGSSIPVMFRMYHEHTGSWFWWGSRQSTPEEYIQLWRMTVEYLRDTRNVHNLLYTYSPAAVENEEQYLERYPGDNYVDIVGFDCYANGENEEQSKEKTIQQIKAYKNNMIVNLDIVVNYADKAGKIPAITETGMERFPFPDFFSEVVYQQIIKNYKISYILFWRNAYNRPTHYYLPYKGSNNEFDFCVFVKEPKILLAEDIKQ
ncbi:MAG: glycoside hydrolase family 26 protein [Candidatus Azobacteroides sp.]|nr:glycoside hydrolase family 26 protein [Candidatus Azobacteroides sp.]